MVLLIMLLLGIIVFGMLLAAKQSITQSSSEGSRAAVGTYGAFLLEHPNPSAADFLAYKDQAKLDAEKRAKDALSWVVASKPASAFQITANVYDCGDPTKTHDTPAGPDCIRTTVDYDNATYPLIPAPWPVNDMTPHHIHSESSAQLDG